MVRTRTGPAPVAAPAVDWLATPRPFTRCTVCSAGPTASLSAARRSSRPSRSPSASRRAFCDAASSRRASPSSSSRSSRASAAFSRASAAASPDATASAAAVSALLRRTLASARRSRSRFSRAAFAAATAPGDSFSPHSPRTLDTSPSPGASRAGASRSSPRSARQQRSSLSRSASCASSSAWADAARWSNSCRRAAIGQPTENEWRSNFELPKRERESCGEPEI